MSLLSQKRDTASGRWTENYDKVKKTKPETVTVKQLDWTRLQADFSHIEIFYRPA